MFDLSSLSSHYFIIFLSLPFLSFFLLSLPFLFLPFLSLFHYLHSTLNSHQPNGNTTQAFIILFVSLISKLGVSTFIHQSHSLSLSLNFLRWNWYILKRRCWLLMLCHCWRNSDSVWVLLLRQRHFIKVSWDMHLIGSSYYYHSHSNFFCLIICLCCFLLVRIRILNINLSFLSKFLCFNSKLIYGFTNRFQPWV